MTFIKVLIPVQCSAAILFSLPTKYVVKSAKLVNPIKYSAAVRSEKLWVHVVIELLLSKKGFLLFRLKFEGGGC